MATLSLGVSIALDLFIAWILYKVARNFLESGDKPLAVFGFGTSGFVVWMAIELARLV